MPPTPHNQRKKVRTLLSNAQVLDSLKSLNPKKKKKKVTHYDWIHGHVSDFLSYGPTARPNLHAALPDSLTEQEKLQIVNIVPSEIVDLFLVIENLNDRFTEAQQEQLLALIQGSIDTMSDGHEQPLAVKSEEAPMAVDEPAPSLGTITEELETQPMDTDAPIVPMEAKSREEPLPIPPQPTEVTLESIDTMDTAKDPVDTKHIMNGGPIPPSTENARNGLNSLPKVKLESS